MVASRNTAQRSAADADEWAVRAAFGRGLLGACHPLLILEDGADR